MKDNRISKADAEEPHVMQVPQVPQAHQAPAVTIKLDGQAREVAVGTTLAQLVTALGHEEKSVSTAVNGEFVARSARSRELLEGDTVLLFQPIVGG